MEGKGPAWEKPAIPRDNGLGALRLLFAALVIISHSVEMVDGSLAREPLRMLFSQLTFGGVAVDGFFLISGYLIAASYASSPSTFFVKRILRIYPAFLVCYILSVIVIAPLAGADLSRLQAWDWARLGYRMLMLKSPEVDGVFEGQHIQALNGSMWTISYEFRCYIMAAVLGALGLYQRARLFLALTACAAAVYLAFHLSVVEAPAWPAVNAVFGELHQTSRLVTVFLCGTAFWALKVKFDGRVALVSGAALVALQFVPGLGELGFMVFGGYVLFWIAFHLRSKWLRTINAKDDISYGLYLYAWPVAALLQLYVAPWTPVSLTLATLLLAGICGACSWWLIEKPALKAKSWSRRASSKDALVRVSGKT
jgi:peptidoglycan/LPS O-acetylase OafA/YrhL